MLSIITCVFAGFNLFYNNLAMNLRFKIKTDCYSIGHLVYDLPNALMCNLCCNWLCRDRWCVKPATWLKWGFKSLWLVAIIATIKVWKSENQWVNDFDSEAESMTNRFDDLLIVYLLQHLIFLSLRPGFLCCLLVCTVCHDHGEPYDKDDSFSDSIISYDYINYMTQRLNHLQDRPFGLSELKMHREQETIKNA